MSSSGHWVVQEDYLRSLRNVIGKPEPTPKKKNRDTKKKRRPRKKRTR